ncbi:excinuclease ABC subunit UvrC, partial [Acidobacteriota bacterium]
MVDAAANLDFEKAAHWRDLIRTLEQIKNKPQLITVQEENKDIIGITEGDDRTAVAFFLMRQGKVRDTQHSVHPRTKDRSLFVQEYLDRFYQDRTDLPDSIILPLHPKNEEEFLNDISSRKGKRIRVIVPQRGINKRLLDFAARNSRLLLDKKNEGELPLEAAQKILDLDRIPLRIEGYDISNTSGEESVGSVVVFENGFPLKEAYRKYRIKTVEGPNDVASIQEVIYRRYTRILSEKGRLPDLILVDGGKGQLNAALSILKSLHIENIPIISIAKKEEIVYRPRFMDGLRIERTSPALKLFQNIRNEAHRFAVTYHRKEREKKSFSSKLDDIPGIGPMKKSKLLDKYRDIDKIMQAPLPELEALIGKKAADKLRHHLGK